MSVLSVVIVVWDQWAFTEACLESLARQELGGATLEVIVVDNGSTDGTVAALRARYPHVRVLELGENTGFAVANNRGVALATGEWILLLNNDTELEPGALRTLLDAVSAHPGFRLAAPQMVQLRAPDLVDNRGVQLDRAGLYRQVDSGRPRAEGPALAEVFGPSGGAALLHREVVDAVGLFDASLHSYLEDGDLACRARAHGFRCLYVAGCAVRHHGSATSARLGDWKYAQIHRNLARLSRRWGTRSPSRASWWLQRGYVASHYLRAVTAGRVGALRRARTEGLALARTDARPDAAALARVHAWVGRGLVPLEPGA